MPVLWISASSLVLGPWSCGDPPADRASNTLTTSSAVCQDEDDDGFQSCTEGESLDCDDENASINPAVYEACNNVDDNCDGEIDEYITGCEWSSIPGPPAADTSDETRTPPSDEGDLPLAPPRPWPSDCSDGDQDGWPQCSTSEELSLDCDDSDSSINPGVYEACDNVDENCDGEVDEYITSCEWSTVPGPPPADIPDDRPPPDEGDLPQAPSSPWPGDCVDSDLDNWPACTTSDDLNLDCDDSNSDINPGVYEACDNVDENCDGEIDEYITNCEWSTSPGGG